MKLTSRLDQTQLSLWSEITQPTGTESRTARKSLSEIRRTRKVLHSNCIQCGHPDVINQKRALCKTCYWRYYDKKAGRGVYRIQALRRDDPARAMVYQYRCKAKKLGLAFDLDAAWLSERLSRGTCEATGLPLQPMNTGNALTKHYRAPFVASLDRIDPAEGYTKSNCRIVAWMFNLAKNAYTDQDVLRLAIAVVSRAVAQGETQALHFMDGLLGQCTASASD